MRNEEISHLNIQLSWNFPPSANSSKEGFNAQSFSKPDLFKVFSLSTSAFFLVSANALIGYTELLIYNSWKKVYFSYLCVFVHVVPFA